MVLVLALHDEDPDGVRYAVNLFLFLDLYPEMGLEAALLTRRQDVVICRGTLSSFVDTSLLLGQ